MGASQLGIFNAALRFVEERKLASLTEQREPLRYLLDEWQNAVDWCLYQGYWRFAIREQQVNNDASQSPAFGYEFCFTKPADWIQTYQIADNESFNPLIRNLEDMNNVWYTDISPIYVKYVSSDPNYGWNLGLWTPGFSEFVAAYLAWLIAPRIKQAKDKVDTLEKLVKRKKIEGQSTDAFSLPPGEFPYDTWVTSRAPRGSILPYGFRD
jgi:hypothetical protein